MSAHLNIAGQIVTCSLYNHTVIILDNETQTTTYIKGTASLGRKIFFLLLSQKIKVNIKKSNIFKADFLAKTFSVEGHSLLCSSQEIFLISDDSTFF